MGTARFLMVALAFLAAGCAGEPSAKMENGFEFARGQLTATMSSLGDSIRYPRTAGQEGLWQCTGPSDWTAGFYPGCLWLMFERTNDSTFRVAAERWTAALEEQKFNGGTHDLGFMLYCSFGNAYRLTGSAHDREVLLQAARTLAGRFNPKIGCIKSWDWGGNRWQYPVIIDNMMNLELLFWASRNGGGDSLRAIAVSHALTTRRDHFRADGSTYHVIDYDTVTGAVVKKQTHQGSADESVWARGQAWGLYGFAVAYREAGDVRFLEAAERAALYLIEHLPEDGVPYWDFRAPGIPDEERDVSSAAIAASALVELSGLAKERGTRELFLATARRILTSLSSRPYLARGTHSPGILNHAVGNKPGASEVDVSLIYADYYYLEALMRYRQAGGFTLRNSLNEFTPSRIESTKAGYQYWFVDRKFLDGRTIKMSVVRPHGATHEAHRHAEEEFFFVLEGTAEVTLNGATAIVRPYASLYCPPNAEHGIRNAGDSELKYLVIKKYGMP
jgi:unsaturated chondroitin disaccharide hydrolase